MKIRVIQQEEWLDGGEYISWAKRNNYQVLFTRCFSFDPIPNEVDADMLLVLGGLQNPSTTVEECPFFDTKKERELIKKYIDNNKIVIGTCLGSQLIGETLGIKYLHSPYPEIGYVKGKITKEGRKDKHFKVFPDELMIGEWHYDMPGVDENTIILMESEGCPRQAVKYSRFVYGFQAHFEFQHESYVKGLEVCNNLDEVDSPYVNSAQEMLSFDTSLMNKCLSDFLDSVVDEYLNEVV